MKKHTGDIIKEYRLKKNFTQQQLARNICSIQHLYRLEKSKRLPSGYIVNELAKKLGKDFLKNIYSPVCVWEIKM